MFYCEFVILLLFLIMPGVAGVWPALPAVRRTASPCGSPRQQQGWVLPHWPGAADIHIGIRAGVIGITSGVTSLRTVIRFMPAMAERPVSRVARILSWRLLNIWKYDKACDFMASPARAGLCCFSRYNNVIIDSSRLVSKSIKPINPCWANGIS